jgi:putative YhdH/YhfP family quinone oxidoreductase
VTPDAGEILVTGATGGVGAFAVAYFSSKGYSVVAATRNMKHESYLKGLGAKEVLSSLNLSVSSSKPLSRGRWAGVVDTVGGEILVNALKSTRQRAVVTCCGMIASDHLSVSIFPFILRGVRLIGLDSAECPRNQKQVIWDRIAEDWSNVPFEKLQSIKGFDNIPEELERMKKGETQGRIVFEIDPE